MKDKQVFCDFHEYFYYDRYNVDEDDWVHIDSSDYNIEELEDDNTLFMCNKCSNNLYKRFPFEKKYTAINNVLQDIIIKKPELDPNNIKIVYEKDVDFFKEFGFSVKKKSKRKSTIKSKKSKKKSTIKSKKSKKKSKRKSNKKH